MQKVKDEDPKPISLISDNDYILNITKVEYKVVSTKTGKPVGWIWSTPSTYSGWSAIYEGDDGHNYALDQRFTNAHEAARALMEHTVYEKESN